jgi:hypothetical protein
MLNHDSGSAHSYCALNFVYIRKFVCVDKQKHCLEDEVVNILYYNFVYVRISDTFRFS